MKPVSRVAGGRIAPALIAVDLVREGRRHWQAQLTVAQRRRLIALLKQSHGDPRNLSAKERREVTAAIGDLDLKAFAKVAATTAVVGKAKRGLKKR